MDVNPEAISTTVELFAAFLLRYSIALAGVGALAMALIEAWKKLFDTRTKYHLRAVLSWFGADHAAYAELIHLTTGVDLPQEKNLLMEKHGKLSHARTSLPADFELSLFTLELERMMGHVQDAATIALRDWRTFPALFAFLTAGARRQDVASWCSEEFRPGATLGAERAGERAAVYARLTALAKAKLDGFQLYTGFRWANGNQLLAVLVGFVVLGAALVWTQIGQGEEIDFGTGIALFALSLLGGALSPIAKDLVVALKRVRSTA
jgi:hypothetical protein